MKTTIKQILETLGKNRNTVRVGTGPWICINNPNVRETYRYHSNYISDQYDSFRIKYAEIVVEPTFTKALANYLWSHCPKAGGKKPKVVYPEGQLNYTDIEDLEIDIMNLTKASIDDGVLEEFLECIYQKNMQ